MKMAKASEADLSMAMDLCNALDVLGQRFVPCMPEAIEQLGDEDESEPFDRHDDRQCGRAMRYLLELTDRASLGRVIWGAAVMLDPANRLVDPAAGTIEHHPDRLKLLAVLKTGTAQQMQDKLTRGQGTDTDDGRTWLAALEVLRAVGA